MTTIENTGTKSPANRNYKCPQYIGCLTVAAMKKHGELDCSGCEHKDAVSQDWLSNEMAC